VCTHVIYEAKFQVLISYSHFSSLQDSTSTVLHCRTPARLLLVDLKTACCAMRCYQSVSSQQKHASVISNVLKCTPSASPPTATHTSYSARFLCHTCNRFSALTELFTTVVRPLPLAGDPAKVFKFGRDPLRAMCANFGQPTSPKRRLTPAKNGAMAAVLLPNECRSVVFVPGTLKAMAS
jgi:hypothetical protein